MANYKESRPNIQVGDKVRLPDGKDGYAVGFLENGAILIDTESELPGKVYTPLGDFAPYWPETKLKIEKLDGRNSLDPKIREEAFRAME